MKSWFRVHNNLLKSTSNSIQEYRIRDRLFSEYLVIEDSLIDKFLYYNKYEYVKKDIKKNFSPYIDLRGYRIIDNTKLYYFYMPVVVYSNKIAIINIEDGSNQSVIMQKAYKYMDIINLRAHATLKKSMLDEQPIPNATIILI